MSGQVIESAAGIKSGAESGAGLAELETLCRRLGSQARSAARHMALAQGSAKNDWLTRSAAALRARAGEIFEANARDVAAAPAWA